LPAEKSRFNERGSLSAKCLPRAWPGVTGLQRSSGRYGGFYLSWLGPGSGGYAPLAPLPQSLRSAGPPLPV